LAENAKEEARINIENKLVSLSTINYWYKRFKSGKISQFKNYNIALAIQRLSSEDKVRNYLSFNLKEDNKALWNKKLLTTKIPYRKRNFFSIFRL
jgi:hypothetical protein